MKRTLLIAALAASLAGAAGADTADAARGVASDLGIERLELQEMFIREFGHIAHGELPGGIPVSLNFDGRDRLSEVKARGLGATFPETAVRAVIPAAVLANAQWPTGGALESVRFEPTDQIKVQGRLADGRSVLAAFTADGRTIFHNAHQ